MLSQFLSKLFGRSAPAQPAAEAQKRDFEQLNALAPVADAAAAADTAEMARSFLCREAVLNAEQRVAGYEFQLRKAARDRVRVQSRRIHHVYNEVVVRNIVQFSIRKLLGHRLAFVPVLDSFLASPVLRELPAQGVVLSVERVAGDEPDLAQVAGQARELREAGFALALEECFDGAHFDALAPLTDYFVVDTARHSPAEIKALVGRLAEANGRAAMVARDLESYDDFTLCQKLGFRLFQGPFITSREDWTANQVGPQGLRVCDLLNRLRRDAETAELAKILRQDAVLSYRLLRYVNSAASGLRQKITSIEHALVMMGRAKLYRWLTLLLFGSAQSVPGAAALLENALVRGRLMELAGQARLKPADQDSLFVTGLFSMLDLVLRVPLAEALRPIQLPEEIPAALLRREGPYAPYLELALACESFDQDRITAASALCGLDAATVNERHIEAITWVQDIDL